MKRLIFSILILLGVIYQVWQYWEAAPEKKQPQSSANTPDYQIESFSRHQFDQQGKRQSQLNADKLSYYQDKKSAYIAQPNYHFYNAQGNIEWTISANTSEITNNKIIYLTDKVEIKNQQSAWLNRIKTQSLTLNVNQQTIKTKHKVNAYGEKIKMSGTGLDADLKQQTFEFNQNVQTELLVN